MSSSIPTRSRSTRARAQEYGSLDRQTDIGRSGPDDNLWARFLPFDHSPLRGSQGDRSARQDQDPEPAILIRLR